MSKATDDERIETLFDDPDEAFRYLRDEYDDDRIQGIAEAFLQGSEEGSDS